MSQRIQAALVGTDFLALPLTGRCVYRAMGGGVNVQLRGVKPHLFFFRTYTLFVHAPDPRRGDDERRVLCASSNLH